jgi:hypothetical protein
MTRQPPASHRPERAEQARVASQTFQQYLVLVIRKDLVSDFNLESIG